VTPRTRRAPDPKAEGAKNASTTPAYDTDHGGLSDAEWAAAVDRLAASIPPPTNEAVDRLFAIFYPEFAAAQDHGKSRR
jgi:hypothetical protein